MHAVVGPFSGNGAHELVDGLERRKAKIERLVGSISGFVSYCFVRTDDGGFSVSVYEDEVGTGENVRVARDWIAKNAGSVGGPAPVVSEGTVIVQLQ